MYAKKFYSIVILVSIMALLSVFILYSTFTTMDLKKELEGLKFELIRIHNEVNEFTDEKVNEIREKDALKISMNKGGN